MFKNLLEVNSMPEWSSSVPVKLSNSAKIPLYIVTGHTKFEDAIFWAEWSNKILVRALEESANWYKAGIAKGELIESQFIRRMSDPDCYSTMEASHTLEDYLGTITIANALTIEINKNLRDDECLTAKILGARALLLFDHAANIWQSGDTVKFIDAFYDAEDVKTSSVHHSSWREGEIYAPADFSALAIKGAKARNAKYQPLKDHAFNLVKNGKYKSRRNAAFSIAPEIIKLSKELRVPLSEQQAPITISGWLEENGLPAKM